MRPHFLIAAFVAGLCLLAGGIVPAHVGGDTSAILMHDQEMPAQAAPTARKLLSPVCPDRTSVLRRTARTEQVTVPILMYHHVRDLSQNASASLRTLAVSADAFAAQMAYLARNDYHTIYFADLLDYFDHDVPLPDNPVIITFDDGWLEQYEVAYPILRKNCLVATFFPPSNWVGNSKLTLTWAQIEEMSKGGMEFGSHTANHYLLTGQTAEQITRQLADSKKALAVHVGMPVVAFAYPGGAYNASVASLVEKAGYGVAVGVSAGTVHRVEERYRLRRVTVNYADTLPVFAARLMADPATRGTFLLTNQKHSAHNSAR